MEVEERNTAEVESFDVPGSILKAFLAFGVVTPDAGRYLSFILKQFPVFNMNEIQWKRVIYSVVVRHSTRTPRKHVLRLIGTIKVWITYN